MQTLIQRQDFMNNYELIIWKKLVKYNYSLQHRVSETYIPKQSGLIIKNKAFVSFVYFLMKYLNLQMVINAPIIYISFS